MRRLLFILTALFALSTAPAFGSSVAGVGYDAGYMLGAGFRTEFTTLPVASLAPVGTTELAPADGSSLLLANGVAWAVGGDTVGQCGCGVRQSAVTRWVRVKVPGVVVQVAAAGGHMMALTNTGQVWTWGGDSYGQLGNGTTSHGQETGWSDLPIRVVGLPPVKAIVAGGASDYAVLTDGRLMAWGENKTGQLGDGTFTERTVPTLARVGAISQLTVGGIGGQGGHAVAILSSGMVVAWGSDGQGQLGDGNTHTSVLPVPVRLSGAVVSVTSAVSHSLAVMADGTLRAWGSNGKGELGTPTTQKCTKALIPCSTTPVAVTGLASVTQASVNFGYSLAVAGGGAYAWGWNQFGQLGNGTRADSSLPGRVSGLSGVQQAAAGVHHALFLLAGEPPPPTITIVAGHLSLAVAWLSTSTVDRWAVNWRPLTKPASPFGKYVYLPPTARSYTVSGLTAGLPVEVLVKSLSFGTRRVQAVPLP